MASTWIIVVLLVFYAVLSGVSLWERNYPRALYFFAAILIQLAVVWGTQKALDPAP